MWTVYLMLLKCLDKKNSNNTVRQTLSGWVLQCADFLVSVFLLCLTGYGKKLR